MTRSGGTIVSWLNLASTWAAVSIYGVVIVACFISISNKDVVSTFFLTCRRGTFIARLKPALNTSWRTLSKANITVFVIVWIDYSVWTQKNTIWWITASTSIPWVYLASIAAPICIIWITVITGFILVQNTIFTKVWITPISYLWGSIRITWIYFTRSKLTCFIKPNATLALRITFVKEYFKRINNLVNT